jgi:hypothetical protein
MYQTIRDVRPKMNDSDLICAPCALNLHVHQICSPALALSPLDPLLYLLSNFLFQTSLYKQVKQCYVQFLVPYFTRSTEDGLMASPSNSLFLTFI